MIMIMWVLYMLCRISLSIDLIILLTTFTGSKATPTRRHSSTPLSNTSTTGLSLQRCTGIDRQVPSLQFSSVTSIASNTVCGRRVPFWRVPLTDWRPLMHWTKSRRQSLQGNRGRHRWLSGRRCRGRMEEGWRGLNTVGIVCYVHHRHSLT